MIKITNEKARELVIAWEGHKVNETNILDCFNRKNKCPIHLFFMQLKRKARRDKIKPKGLRRRI